MLFSLVLLLSGVLLALLGSGHFAGIEVGDLSLVLLIQGVAGVCLSLLVRYRAASRRQEPAAARRPPQAAPHPTPRLQDLLSLRSKKVPANVGTRDELTQATKH